MPPAGSRITTAFISLALVILPGRLFGQASAVNASIEGVIKDSTGAVLPGVTITLTNVATGVGRTVVTNEAGLYRAQLLPLGVYRLETELAGFQKFTREGIQLAAGETAVVNLVLAVGGWPRR